MTRPDRSRLPEPGPDPAFRFPSVAKYTLANGLKVRTVEHDSVPVVTFVISVDGGLGADAAGYEGLAALVADLVDEGTGPLTAIDVSDALARIGGEYDVEVGADASIFTLTTLGRFATRGGELLASLITNPAMRDDDYVRVRQLRLDRLRQLKDLPPAVAERAFVGLLYGTHPYGHLAIGTETALRSMNLSDAVEFHDASYRPEHATLVVGGPMPHASLAAIAEEAFGSWRPSSGTVQLTLAADRAPKETPRQRLALVPRDAAAQSELRIGHLSARRDTPDYAPLVVMNAVLGGQFVSRVNLKLREEKGFTYGARTGFDWRRGLGPFALQASVHTAATGEAIGDSLAELHAIRGDRPPTGQELLLAKASLTRGYPRNFETTQQVARAAWQLSHFGLPDRYFEEFVPKVEAVTVDEVTRVARAYLDPSRAITLVVGDRSTVEPSLQALGLGDVEIFGEE